MNLRSRLTIQAIVYFSLILLPALAVLSLFFFDRMVNQFVLAGMWLLAVVGTFMVVKTVATMRGLRDDEKTRQWLDAAGRRDEANSLAEERDEAKEKRLDELRGRKDARLAGGSAKPTHWLSLDDAGLQGQVARLLKKLGRRVQRTGDSAGRGFDLVVDNNAVVQCSTRPKGEANAAATELLATLRANPTCTAALDHG